VASLVLLAPREPSNDDGSDSGGDGSVGDGGGDCSPVKRRRRASRPLLAVGNTHLLFNPKRGDIKMAQLRLLTSALDRLAAGGGGRAGAAVLLTGDMNHAPHSPVYEFVARGQLDCLLHQRSDLSGGRPPFRPPWPGGPLKRGRLAARADRAACLFVLRRPALRCVPRGLLADPLALGKHHPNPRRDPA
jgi:hypothetical protein